MSVSLNLFYDNAADLPVGGNWSLVAKTTNPNGIAALHVIIDGISGTGITYQPFIGAQTSFGQAYRIVDGSVVELLYFQDSSFPSMVVPRVGRGPGTPGNVVLDPLGDPNWNNSAVIARGRFGATRPAFSSSNDPLPDATDANVLSTITAPFDYASGANVNYVVRDYNGGDYSHNGVFDAADYVLWRKGDRAADGNGNLIVDAGDYEIWRSAFGTSGVGPFPSSPAPIHTDSGGDSDTVAGLSQHRGIGSSKWLAFTAGGEPSIPGDSDCDGDVDGADLLRWQRGLGINTGATRLQGDMNGDGDVDAADLADWRANYGINGSAAVTQGVTVPEPLTWVQVCLIALSGLLFPSRACPVAALTWRRSYGNHHFSRRQ
ncbi:MAG: dockerin type I repeat-containing protein [Pirellulales bacterium]